MVHEWPPMKWRGPSVAEADIAAFEGALGRRLPEDYRAFLFDVNGGRLEKTHRRFAAGVVNMLLSLNATEDESEDLLTRATRAFRDLPGRELLFVGYTDGGARIVVVLEGEHRGEVWMQIMSDARPEDANPRVEWFKRRDMKKLADSFEQFMSSLQPLYTGT